MTGEADRAEPYQSALDLPSVSEMLEQIKGAKLLTRLVARRYRNDILRTESQVRDIADVVDRFYSLLGDRHWIFHDHLNLEGIRGLLDGPPDEAERALIEMYQEPETLDALIRMVWRFPAMRIRRELIEVAEADYFERRYYSTVLVLLAVMDGFVNDLEPAQRRGLHTRDPDELNAWDSVVGHHLGLTNAHETFTRTFKRVSDEPVHELFRNGIVHGVLVNFNNDIVATKAWNRLFAVADWATSLERRATPAKPDPKWRDVLKQIRDNAEAKKALEVWTPRSIEAGNPEFLTDPVHTATVEYLDAWSARNYGAMAHLVASILAEDSHGQIAGMLRDSYDHLALSSYSIGALDFTAPAVCEVAVRLVINGDERAGKVRWIRERPDGSPATPNQGGEWRLAPWEPNASLNRVGGSPNIAPDDTES